MKYETTISFAGKITAYKGQLIELTEEQAKPLLDCGYIVERTESSAEKRQGKKQKS